MAGIIAVLLKIGNSEQDMGILDRIRIVLVNTSHPGNIGSTARAMKTMGLSQLVLVEPLLFPHGLATGLASNADDILTRAQVVDSLDQALQGCGLVLGTSARVRALSWEILTPVQAVQQALTHASQGDVAIVFGREDAGLTNQELQKCHAHICIPANPIYNVLNLAQAVQIICYEFHKATLTAEALPEAQEALASYEDVQQLYVHIRKALELLGFHDPEHSKQLMPRIKRMFARIRLEKREVSILRGALKAILLNQRRKK